MKNYMFGFITWMSCLVVMVSAIPAKAESISIDDAADLVTSVIPETNTNMYLCQNYDGEELYWKFFVDAVPMANWGHRCYVVTVPKNTETLSTQDVQLQVLSDLPDIELEPYRINVCGISSNSLETEPIEISPLPTLYNYNANRAGKNYAVIINGGYNKQKNYHRYWNDCSLIYRVLTKRYGFEKENIYVAISDGTDPEPDMNLCNTLGVYEYVSSPLDLDFDGQNDVGYAATYSEIELIFSELRNTLTKDDHLFIFVTDHGGRDPYYMTNEMESYISLWGGRRLFVSELRDMLMPIRSKDVAVSAVFGQCYSGGFKMPLSNIGCVVATACDEYASSYATPDYQYDAFLLAWTIGMCGFDTAGNAVNSDSNGDGMVSMKEAYNYAKENDIYASDSTALHREDPQYSSEPEEIGEYLAFNYNPPAYDLKLRNSLSDNLIINKNSKIIASWDSPDIWLRNSDDGDETHQTLNASNFDKAYVNVRINNIGRCPNEYNFRVDVKWALAGIVNSSDYFNGEMEFHGYPMGGNIGSVDIPMIDPFNNQVFTIEWTLPPTLRYALESETIKLKDILLFAEIIQTDLPAGTAVESTKDLYAKAMVDHHAAIKNNIFANSQNQTLNLRLGNIGTSTEYHTLSIYNEGTSALNFFDNYSLIIQMPQLLYNKWRNAGGTTSCSKVSMLNGYANFPFKSAADYISNIPIAGGISELVRVSVSMKPNAGPGYIDFVQRTGYAQNIQQKTIRGGIRLYASKDAVNSTNLSIPQSLYNIANKDNMIEGDCVKIEIDRSAEHPVDVVVTDILSGNSVARGIIEVGTDVTSISSAEIGAGLYSVDIRVGDSVTDSAKISIK